ncbi:MAG: N-acetylneuraminate synthase family protein [Bacillota bacterium]|nr:N-acetylneuraminate synthase family protein [Bacillota bacterium]
MVIKIEKKRISLKNPTYIIAEAGVNHNGSPEMAKKLVDAAREAGADAVKFQLFKTEDLIAPGNHSAQREILSALELTAGDLKCLKEYCSDAITFLCSPFDYQSACLLDQIGVPAFKVGSGEISNLPLLEIIASFRKPVILSTGMSGLKEIEEALEVLSGVPVALLHCTTDYPARYKDLHLNVIHTLKPAFGRIVGYSDHSPGLEAPIAAAALGYKIIEKHLTLDRKLPGPDHRASLEPWEFKKMVEGIRRVEKMLGKTLKKATAREEEMKRKVRKSLYLAQNLPAGHSITPEDLVSLRPLAGIEPDRWGEVLGRKLKGSKPKGQPLYWHDLE